MVLDHEGDHPSRWAAIVSGERARECPTTDAFILRIWSRCPLAALSRKILVVGATAAPAKVPDELGPYGSIHPSKRITP
jgi:hypothetical protein